MTDTAGWTLVIHGGSGIIERGRLTPEADAGARTALGRALDAGSAILTAGGAAIDAVQAAIEVLEDDPHFNAGRGAALTFEGGIEAGKPYYEGAMAKYYHKLTDEWRADYDFTAALQNLDLLYRLGLTVADSESWPAWKPTAEFNAIRDRTADQRR